MFSLNAVVMYRAARSLRSLSSNYFLQALNCPHFFAEKKLK